MSIIEKLCVNSSLGICFVCITFNVRLQLSCRVFLHTGQAVICEFRSVYSFTMAVFSG